MSTTAGPRASRDTLGGLPWLRIQGEHDAVFRALGRLTAEQIAGFLETAPELGELRGRAGSRFLRDVVAASRAAFPLEATEIDLIAEGADVDPTDLWLMNLRGDLGRWGEGCSDVAVSTGDSVYLAHNEDGHAGAVGRVALLTLHVEGDPAVCAFSYPGLLPAIAWWVNSHGIAAGLNHIPSTSEHVGAGRHLLARRVQRSGSLGAALREIEAARLAGSYAFNLCHPSAGSCLVEVGPEGVHVERVDGLVGHTNHFRWLPGATDDEDSRDRLAALEELPAGADADEILARLRSPRLARDGTRPGRLVTLCTVVLDMAASTATIHTGESAVTLPHEELLAPPT